MSEFKVGDEVVTVNGWGAHLPNGIHHIVIRIIPNGSREQLMEVSGTGDIGWCQSRFTKVQDHERIFFPPPMKMEEEV